MKSGLAREEPTAVTPWNFTDHFTELHRLLGTNQKEESITHVDVRRVAVSEKGCWKNGEITEHKRWQEAEKYGEH